MSTEKVNSVKRKYWRRNKASSSEVRCGMPPANRRACSTQSKRSNSDKGLFHGLKISPPVNPPDATAQPWNQVTLQHITNPGPYTIANLITIIRTQLDPTKRGFNTSSVWSDADNAFRIQIRLKAVLVWNLTGKVLGLSINDFTSAKFGGDQLGGWVDCGGPAHFPAVGFRYPATHQNFVLRPDKAIQAEELFVITAGDKDSILIHIHINWRFDGPIRFTLPRQIANIISDNVASIRKNQPSVYKTVVDGAAVAASVVKLLPAVAATSNEDSLDQSTLLRSEISIESRLLRLEELLARASISDAGSETSTFEDV